MIISATLSLIKYYHHKIIKVERQANFTHYKSAYLRSRLAFRRYLMIYYMIFISVSDTWLCFQFHGQHFIVYGLVLGSLQQTTRDVANIWYGKQKEKQPNC